MKVRVGVCLNAGPRRGQAEAVVLAAPEAEAILAAAANKLRLKKKDVSRAQLYVWSSGTQLARDGSSVVGSVRNGDLIAITVGEPYLGPVRSSSSGGSVRGTGDDGSAGAGSSAGSSLPGMWLRWEARPLAGSFAVVEWSDARAMNSTLGRMSTLLEHPTLCGLATARVVSHAEQRTLPSASYLGHNLYAALLLEFERLVDQQPEADELIAASPAERDFLTLWRRHGAPEVVVSYVAGERETLRHELCHARFALDTAYRAALTRLWEAEWSGRLSRWLRDLGYHPSRHADEFGAYVLTEPHTFWRGRVSVEELQVLRGRLSGLDGPSGLHRRGETATDSLSSVSGRDSGHGSGHGSGELPPPPPPAPATTTAAML